MAKKDPLTDLRRARFRDWCTERGWLHPSGDWAVEKAAAAVGKKYQQVSNLLNGHGSFGATLARELEQAVGLPPNYFDTGEGSDFVDVPRINVVLAAGDGAVQEVEEVVGHLKFSHSFLRNCGLQPATSRVVDVRGHSMDPTIKDGAVLLISTRNREPVDNQVFALARPVEGLVIKRLRLVNGQWVARSDNAEWPDIPINDGEPVTIIGRAVWMGARL